MVMTPGESKHNPFCVPGRTIRNPGPLIPWKENCHADFYVAVDHTEQAYQDFDSNLQNWNIKDSGEAVLVHGEDGCGKTSLIHRCASKISDSQRENKDSVLIIDRSGEHLDGQTSLSKCVDVVTAVLREIRMANNFLPAADIDNLRSRSPQADEGVLRDIMEDISAYLFKAHRILIVIPPKLDLTEELRLYRSVFVKRCLALLMETSDEGIRQFVDRWNNDPMKRRVLSLSVGPLKAENGWNFVQARMSTITEIAFDQVAVNQYMKARCERAKVSIRELERVCIALFEEAVSGSKTRIDYSDFADLWVRRGGGIR